MNFANPEASTIEKIADFFNVTIDSLFVRTRQPIDYETETDMVILRTKETSSSEGVSLFF